MKIQSPHFTESDLKRIIVSLIIEDFKVNRFLKKLERVGFNCESYPDIAFVVFDLMGISKSLQTDDLTAFYIREINSIRASHQSGDKVLNSLAESVFMKLRSYSGPA